MPGPKGDQGEKGSQYYSQEELRALVLTTLKVEMHTNQTARTNLKDREYWGAGVGAERAEMPPAANNLSLPLLMHLPEGMTAA